MLEPLLGSRNAERVLIFIMVRGEGYGREIARHFGADPDSIRKQLAKYESGGVLTGKSLGRTRVYSFNPRYPFVKQLTALLETALVFYSDEEQHRLRFDRRRPRRRRKPL